MLPWTAQLWLHTLYNILSLPELIPLKMKFFKRDSNSVPSNHIHLLSETREWSWALLFNTQCVASFFFGNEYTPSSLKYLTLGVTNIWIKRIKKCKQHWKNYSPFEKKKTWKNFFSSHNFTISLHRHGDWYIVLVSLIVRVLEQCLKITQYIIVIHLPQWCHIIEYLT